MKRILAVGVFVLLLLVQANVGRAAGFLIYEHGAAAMAMAGAFISIANNPSAIWHNPAGIAFLKGTQVSLGTTLIFSSGKMTLTNWPYPQPSKTWEQKSQMYYPSTVYFTHSLDEKVTVGFGFCSPFGLGAKWPMENQLRYLGYEDDMKTFFFNPTVGVKLTDNLSVGLGFSYIYSTVTFKNVEPADFRPLGYDLYDVPAVMKGNGHSWNFNAGVLYRGEKFGVGLNYRSNFNIKFKGDMTLDTSNVPSPFQPYIPNTAKGETTFKFPDILGVGVSYNVTPKLLLSADAHYVLWSRFDKYELKFTEQDQGLPLETKVVDEKFKDAWTLRGGLQYTLSEGFALRGGFLYDFTPQPVETMDPLLPDANRYAITAGFGWKLTKNLVLDMAFHHEIFNDRPAPNRDIYLTGYGNFGESLYETSAELLALSLSFVF